MLKDKSLSKELLKVICDKGTEYAFTGEYTDLDKPGTYLCRRCGLALFRAENKFHSGCGWASFDSAIINHVKRQKDADGHRTEILCIRCDAHLGHEFQGEGFTFKNVRHCVNSASLDFVENTAIIDTQEAIFAAGCFWGVEHYFKKLPGVVKTEVGYIGGEIEKPSYKEVCSTASGHVEAIRVLFDPSRIDYKALAQYFFEIHDPTQKNGQGPDIGEQYKSVIFYYNELQKNISLQLIEELTQLAYNIVTELKPVSVFWPAENYHQNYYAKNGEVPYCHFYTKRFKK